MKLLTLLFLMVSTSTSVSAQNVLRLKAKFLYCKPYEASECKDTLVYDEALGAIVFESRLLPAAVVAAGGKDLIEASLMTGTLQAMKIITERDYVLAQRNCRVSGNCTEANKYDTNLSYLLTQDYIVTGFFSKDEWSSKDVFTVWSIELAK